MNKQTINNYTEKKQKGEYKGFIDESSTYKTLPEKEVINKINQTISNILEMQSFIINYLIQLELKINKIENTRS